jgi:hypothetical protein
MKVQDIPFRSFNRIRDHFVDLCVSDKFYKFVVLAMKCREIHRRKQYGLPEDSDNSFVVPDSVTHLDSVLQCLIENGELAPTDD